MPSNISHGLPFFKDLQAKPFELQVWLVITVIGGLRTFKAVVQDLINPTSVAIMVIDTFILVIFVSLCVLIYKEKISRIPIIVGVLLIILLIFSYVQFGGVQGASEYNLMALGVLLVLAYRKQQLVRVMVLFFALIIIANLDLRYDGWLTKKIFQGFSVSRDNYFSTLFTLLLLMLYFKNALINESNRLMQLRTKLSSQIKTIKRQYGEVEIQQQQLHEINAGLEEEIRKHTSDIINQNKAIEEYISLSTKSLIAPIQNIFTNLQGLQENDFLEKQLKDQVAELQLVVRSLKEELK